jgi:hypothetical protein
LIHAGPADRRKPLGACGIVTVNRNEFRTTEEIEMRSLAFLLLTTTVAIAPLAAQTAAPAPAAAATAPATAAAAATAPATAAPTAVAAGQAVVDTAGAPVGTIEAVNNGVATLSTGTTKVGVPVTSFAMGPKGPVIGLTKAEIEAKAAQATQALNVTVGAEVKDTSGAKVGTVKAVNGDLVTVASATASADLGNCALAPGQNGLVIGMTAAQFEAAAKAAGGGAKAPSKG